MDNSVNTPEKLEILLREHDFSDLDKTPSYVVKAYYDDINMLKEHYGFSLRRILDSINNSLFLDDDDKISYQAFRSALRRVSAKRNSLEGRPSMLLNSGRDNKIRAHEKEFITEHKATATVDSEETLPDAWGEILNRHPTIKAISLHKAIDSGLPIEKAKEASKEGTKQLLEVLNKYRNKTFR